jgi:hypothetical protein
MGTKKGERGRTKDKGKFTLLRGHVYRRQKGAGVVDISVTLDREKV